LVGRDAEFEARAQHGEFGFDMICIHTVLSFGPARAARTVSVAFGAGRIRMTRFGL
jgi:hypothetical protein